MRQIVPLLAVVLLSAGCQPAGKVKRTLALNELQNHAGYAETQGDDARALELWGEYVERRPHSAYARHRLGGVLMRTGQPGEAVEHFRVAHDLRPGEMAYLESLAEALHQAGRRDELFQLLRETMSEGGLAAGHVRYATYAIRSGLIDEAEESLRIAAALEGTQSDRPHRMLAELARQIGDTEREIEAWRTVLWFDGSDAEAHARLSELGVIPGPSLALPPRTAGAD